MHYHRRHVESKRVVYYVTSGVASNRVLEKHPQKLGWPN